MSAQNNANVRRRVAAEVRLTVHELVELSFCTMALPVPWCLPRRRYYLRAPRGRGNPPHLRGEWGDAAPAPRRADHHKVCDSRAWGSGVCARARCVGKQQWFHYSTEFPHSEFLPRLPRNAIPRSVTRASALTRPCLPRCEGQRRGRAPRRPPDLTRASARWEACRDTGYPLSCRRAIVQRCRCLNTTGVAVS